MKISPFEANSLLWQKLSAVYTDKLQRDRSRLEANCPQEETLRLRERIKIYKAFLAMAQPGRETEADAE